MDDREFGRLLGATATTGCQIAGDVTVTVRGVDDFLAWARLLDCREVVAWRAAVSGRRHLVIRARLTQGPVFGYVTVTLDCQDHRSLWRDLLSGPELECGADRSLSGSVMQRLRTADHSAA